MHVNSACFSFFFIGFSFELFFTMFFTNFSNEIFYLVMCCCSVQSIHV